MTLTGVTLLVACVDGLIGAAVLVLVLRNLDGRLNVPLFGRHRRDDDDDDERDWRERRGRYAGLDPDTPDRPQVKPVSLPPVEQRTHNLGDDGIRQREAADDDGPWRAGDE
jgi:hypothetical protein